MNFVSDLRVAPALLKMILVLLFLAVTPLSGQDGILDELEEQDPCSIRLFSSVKAYQPGVSFEVGVLIEPESGWHGYWHSPRDGGDAPETTWQLPEDWKVSGPDFPVPQRMVETGDLIAIGYKKPFLMRYRIHPAESVTDADDSAVEIPLNVTWQVCKKTCIYGESQATLKIQEGSKPILDEKGQATIARWKDRFPVEASNARGYLYDLDWFPDAHSGRVRSGTWVVRWGRVGPQAAIPIRWQAFPHRLQAGVISEATIKPWIPDTDRKIQGWQASFRLEELGLGFQSDLLSATLIPTPGKAKGPVPGMPAIIIRALQAVQFVPPESGSGQKKGSGR